MATSLFQRLRLSTRLPIMVLVLAPALLYFIWFGPRASRAHPVVFRFDPPLSNVHRLTATWTTEDNPGEPLAGSTFDLRQSPGSDVLRSTVQAPDGDVWVDLEFETARGSLSMRRKVNLGDGEITLILPAPRESESP